ncbi:MAG: zinc ribbon domain-containing protein [Nitrospiraceae bacterium]
MPIYEYVAHECGGPADCPRRFALWQRMGTADVVRCDLCRAPLTRVLSTFSASVDAAARSAEAAAAQVRASGPPATLHNMFGGGLGIRGCGYGPLPRQTDSVGADGAAMTKGDDAG